MVNCSSETKRHNSYIEVQPIQGPESACSLQLFTCCPIKQREMYLQNITCFSKDVGMETEEEKVFHFLVSGCTPCATIFARFILLLITAIKCCFLCFLMLKNNPFNLSVSLNVLQALQHLYKHPMWGALDISIFFHRCLITSPKVSDYSLLESQMMLFPISGNSP